MDAADRTLPLFLEEEHQPAPRTRRPSKRAVRQRVIDAACEYVTARDPDVWAELVEAVDALKQRMEEG